MTAENIKLLCILSVLSGAMLSLMKKGNIRSIAELMCGAMLTAVILSPLKELDIDGLALQSARLHELETELSGSAAELEERLNRLVIEDECAEYIKDKAKDISSVPLQAAVRARWSMNGLWVPYSAVLQGQWSERDRARLGAIIESSLGIPADRQEWSDEG